MVQRPDAILIAGPTASGKSKLALQQALHWGGEIVNADSMQIYPVLNVLTARPSQGDQAIVPHHLYGFAPVDRPFSVAQWLKRANSEASEIWERGKLPVFVGGTGLYFKALEHGLAEIPDIPADIRQGIRSDLLRGGSEKLHERLQHLDPAGAARLNPGDSQRIARALEVVTATGQSLLEYQNRPTSPSVLSGKSVVKTVLLPPRSTLCERIDERAEWMIGNGAMDEVMELLKLDLSSALPVMKAIGVRQLALYLDGALSLDETTVEIKTATRQYAKRQSTWFRGQLGDGWDIDESSLR